MSGRSAAPGSAPLHSAPAAARLALRSGRLGSAQLCAPQRRRAGPAAALRSARSPRAALLSSRPPVRLPAGRPLCAAPSLARALLGPPAGPLLGPSGFARALAVGRGRSRVSSAPAPRPPLPEFRLGRATWLPAAPQAPDADAGLYLVRLSLPPRVRTAVAAAERHGPLSPAGHAPSVCRHLPLCREHLESPCASVFGGEWGRRKSHEEEEGAGLGPRLRLRLRTPPPPPRPPSRPQPVLFGDVSSPPPTPFTSAPPFIRPLPPCTRRTLSPRPGAPPPPPTRAPASLPEAAGRSP